MKVSFQKYIDKLKNKLVFSKIKSLFCSFLQMVNNLYDENIQAIGGQHPICTSWAQIPLGIFFHSELIICSHSFYVPNIYQSTVYLSLYLSKLKFTVNLTFQGVLFHLNKHIIHDLCLFFLIFFIFWVFLPFFLLFLFTLKIVSLKGEEFVTKSRVLMIILPFFYNLL